jgi:glyoxylase-like metal-dependent hydrolase (beta-lactamase superfamily II)
MPRFICETCGTQYPESADPPAQCTICEEPRQYVRWKGQRWTTLHDLRESHRAEIREEEAGLTGIGTDPSFAIGQRALLVQAPSGNVLWDCISLFDDEIGERVEGLGGISAIAISHPHYYSSMVEWSHAFDAPVYLHAADRRWVVHESQRIEFWEEETKELGPGLTLIRCGGHFAGGAVLRWAAGCGGRGALLSGDILQVVEDRRWVSFMYSYPNLIPLPAEDVRRIAAAVEPYSFERIYGAWFDKVVTKDAKAALRRSVERYVAALAGTFPPAEESEGA